MVLSCSDRKTVQIWTDRPEFAVYGELFNTAQTRYKVSIKYYDNPGQELQKAGNTADIIVGSWLKTSVTGAYFRSLDNLFGANKLSRGAFYPRLLSIGRIERNQYLLPVSFNIPALIFFKDSKIELSNSFTVDFNEIKTLSKNYNNISREAYTKIGFSPLWSNDFLMITSVLLGASFKTASPLSWDASALERSMNFVNDWTTEFNTSIQAEEEFIFRYFFEPPEKLVQKERILFSYMDSRDFFILNEESKSDLDYRWIMEQSRIPIIEDMVLIGIPKRARSVKAARAFIQWFFTIENQRLILEYCTETKVSENVFGICGGFSALNTVTEQVFPHYYPELLGRMPPSNYLMTPNVLPGNWADIREKVVLPYLYDRSRSTKAEEVYPLERRLADWMRMNR